MIFLTTAVARNTAILILTTLLTAALTAYCKTSIAALAAFWAAALVIIAMACNSDSKIFFSFLTSSEKRHTNLL
jgi:type IV secretory pathway TrbD component